MNEIVAKEDSLEYANALVLDGQEDIRNGFMKIGQGLYLIKEHEHWRLTHASFGDFINDKYGFSKSWGYKKIEHYQQVRRVKNAAALSKITTGAARVVTSTESHVAVLSMVPDEALEEVVETVVEYAKKKKIPVTAALLKRAAVEIIDEPKDEPEPLSRNAVEAVENAAELRAICTVVRQVVMLINGIEEKAGLTDFLKRKQSVLLLAEQIAATIKMATPVAVCPRCHGEGCAQCQNLGWVNSVMKRELEQELEVDF